MLGCKGRSKLLYRLTLVTGVVECLCFAGVVFGYAPLVFVLKEDGYFSEFCVNITHSNHTVTNPDCSKKDEHFSLVFTIASFLQNLLSLPNGYIFDRFGTMATRLLAIFLYTTGTLLVAFSSAAHSALLFPALSCIAVGGIILLITNMQVGNLFSGHRSTIINLYNGAFDSSAAIFVISKLLYEWGYTLRNSFLLMSACSIIHLLRTFLLMPRKHIPYPLPEGYTYGVLSGKANTYIMEKTEKTKDEDMTHNLGEGTVNETTSQQPHEESDAQLSEKDSPVVSFRSCVLSWFFLWHLLWLSIMQLRHYFFIGTFNPMLNRLAVNDPTLVSHYTNAFAFTQLCGVFCAPWNGLIIDRHKGRPLAPGETEQEADLRSCSLSLFVTSLQCLLFSACASIPLLPLQYLTYVLQVINRAFLFGGHAAFVSIAFPGCHFGKIYGLLLTLSAVFSLLQYPCFSLVKEALDGDPLYMNIALTLLTLLTFIHPLYIFIQCRKLASQRKKTVTVASLGYEIAQIN